MVNKMNKKVKLRYDRIAICLIVFIAIITLLIIGIIAIYSFFNPKMETRYLASNSNNIALYDKNKAKVSEIVRGTKVTLYLDTIEEEYNKIKVDNKVFFVLKENIVNDYKDIVLENELYVRTPMVLKEDETKIVAFVPKATKLEVIGFDEIDKDGNVLNYNVKYKNSEGFIKNEYLVNTLDESKKNYDEENSYLIHVKRTSEYGGDAAELDFYPREKAKFKNNVMPEKVSSLYLNGTAINNVDDYIELAKDSNVNAFVVDIKDSVLSYKSDVAKELSPKSYKSAITTIDKFRTNISKLKEEGYYVIGRISVFKDYSYATDNPEYAITDKIGSLYKHNGSYWPSAFSTKVWEYNISLAVEAVELFGFNEIQFDYVRFPDGTSSLEKDNIIDMKNTYNISKIQAIQTFLIYATDILHQKGVYVSADVFGESAHSYVNSYGQYWGAISNVVDVISAMPYPDHFNIHQYGITEAVWTNPYKLLYTWCKDYAMKRQAEVPTPAVMRTWIQAYNTTKSPATVYDSSKIADQIKALEDAKAIGGYMTWNSASSLTKYKEIINSL